MERGYLMMEIRAYHHCTNGIKDWSLTFTRSRASAAAAGIGNNSNPNSLNSWMPKSLATVALKRLNRGNRKLEMGMGNLGRKLLRPAFYRPVLLKTVAE